MKRLLDRAVSALGATALVAAGLAATAAPTSAAEAYTVSVDNKPSCTQTQPRVTVRLSFADKGPTAIGFDSTRDPDTWFYALRSARNGTHRVTLPKVPSGYAEEFRIKLEHNPGTSKKRTYYSQTFTFAVPECPGAPELFTTAPAPTAKGTRMVTRTLTAATSGWDPKPSSFTYQWQRGHVGNIAGATRSSYVLKPADRGRRIRVVVTARLKGYADMRMTSPWTVPVQSARFTTTPTPSITGTPAAGRTLTAWPGSWKPAASRFQYQWYRSGMKVPGATSRFYKVTSRDKGRTVKVKVTAVRSGFLSASMTSRTVKGR